MRESRRDRFQHRSAGHYLLRSGTTWPISGAPPSGPRGAGDSVAAVISSRAEARYSGGRSQVKPRLSTSAIETIPRNTRRRRRFVCSAVDGRKWGRTRSPARLCRPREAGDLIRGRVSRADFGMVLVPRGASMETEGCRREASRRRGRSGSVRVPNRTPSRPPMMPQVGASMRKINDDKLILPRPGHRICDSRMRTALAMSRGIGGQ